MFGLTTVDLVALVAAVVEAVTLQGRVDAHVIAALELPGTSWTTTSEP